jgi:TRAP-type mannitol/chloroaromatic compound transport system permease small subunit|tara:strand:+ start:279 stop:398 length:120 start_codon:yes stop_codon:yes gene_type:complete
MENTIFLLAAVVGWGVVLLVLGGIANIITTILRGKDELP